MDTEELLKKLVDQNIRVTIGVSPSHLFFVYDNSDHPGSPEVGVGTTIHEAIIHFIKSNGEVLNGAKDV